MDTGTGLLMKELKQTCSGFAPAGRSASTETSYGPLICLKNKKEKRRKQSE